MKETLNGVSFIFQLPLILFVEVAGGKGKAGA